MDARRTPAVQHGATLGDINRLAGPHLLTRFSDTAVLNGGDGGIETGLRPALLGDIDEEAGDIEAHARQAVRIGIKLVSDLDGGIGIGLGFQGVEGHFIFLWSISRLAIFNRFHVKLLTSRKEPICRVF